MPSELAKPNLLYLVHRFPYPPDKGDRIRTFQILKYLSQRANVHLACLTDEPVAPDDLRTVERYCQRLALAKLGRLRWGRALLSLAIGKTATVGAFHSSQLAATLQEWALETPFDVALASSSSMAPYLRRAGLARVPAVVDLIDVDSQKWFDYAAKSRAPKGWLYALEGHRLRRLERSLTRWTKALTLVSAAEVEVFRRFCAEGVVEAIGNGVDLDYFHPSPRVDEKGCVFLGALDYPPNIDAVRWFCREVWPAVFARHPEATFSLVGRRPVAAVQRLGEMPGVRLIGQVQDVRPYLADAAVSVAPLRIARGLQNKVLESLAVGKATVVSPQGLEGLAANPGDHLLTASTAKEWIDAIETLLADPSLRRRLGEAGRRYTEDHHRWVSCLAPFDALLGLCQPICPSDRIFAPHFHNV